MTHTDRKEFRNILVKELMACYEEVKASMSEEEFEILMTDFTAEILVLQGQSTKPGGISFAAAGMGMCAFMRNDDVEMTDEDRALIIRTIMASIAWYSLSKDELDEAMDKLTEI